MITLGAFCLILNNKNEVLLCHRRDKDLWNLPGGKVEDGEAPWQAAEREVEEEVGVKAQVLALIGIYFKPKENDLVFMFRSEIISQSDFGLTAEADQISFFSVSSIPPNTSFRHKERIQNFFDNKTKEVILKIQ